MKSSIDLSDPVTDVIKIKIAMVNIHLQDNGDEM